MITFLIQKSWIELGSFDSSLKKQICKVTLVAIFGVILIKPSRLSAVTCDSLTGTISSSCTNYVTGQTNLDVAIYSGVTVTTSGSAAAVGITADSSSLTIYGSADGSINASGLQGVVIGTVNGAGTGTGKASLGSLQNFGTINSSGSSAALLISRDAVLSPSVVTLISNSGTIQNSISGAQSNSGIRNLGTITSLINTGSVTGGAYGINNAGTITSITNTGSIIGGTYGIINSATASIGTINNSGTLTYTGVLPSNYNVIINSASSFGTFASATGTSATSGTAMNFGIYSGSSVTVGSYASVLTGTYITNPAKTGTFGIYSWTLANQTGNASAWDLSLAVADNAKANTQSSISAVISASGLQGAVSMQSAVLINGLSYDCNLFDINQICISTGARQTNIQSGGLDNSGGLLIGAYRLSDQLHFGAFFDQGFSPSASNSLVKTSNKLPFFGTFVGWNDNTESTGLSAKASIAMGRKGIQVTRPIVDNSEPGSGPSSLQTQGAQLISKYGYALTERFHLAPYVGVRYISNFMNTYTEDSSSSVTAPLTYDAFKISSVTTLLGLQSAYSLSPGLVALASIGLESDIHNWGGNYRASSSVIAGISSENFYSGIVRNRPIGSIGFYYDIEKNQRLGIQTIYRKEAYGAISSTSTILNYTVGI